MVSTTLFRILLKYWASVNPIDRMGGTPLSDAVRHGHLEVQRLLRAHGGKLAMEPVELGTLACEAASTGDLDGLRVSGICQEMPLFRSLGIYDLLFLDTKMGKIKHY